MRVEIEHEQRLWFDDGAPVRAASAVVPFGDGLLVAQDDANHAAWVTGGTTSRLRLFPARDGLDLFDSASGTKHLKPDVEAACLVGRDRVLLLGSGSTAARCRAAVVTADDVVVRDLTPLYDLVSQVLETPEGALNLEGACVVEGRLRWFRRGAARLASASVDLDLDALLAAVGGTASWQDVSVTSARCYDLGESDGVPLAVTDAVTLRDGRVLVSAAAEDTPSPVDDGPVVASALVLLDGDGVLASAELPLVAGVVPKVEGLALLPDGAVVAVVDEDDATAASSVLRLRLAL